MSSSDDQALFVPTLIASIVASLLFVACGIVGFVSSVLQTAASMKGRLTLAILYAIALLVSFGFEIGATVLYGPNAISLMYDDDNWEDNTNSTSKIILVIVNVILLLICMVCAVFHIIMSFKKKRIYDKLQNPEIPAPEQQ